VESGGSSECVAWPRREARAFGGMVMASALRKARQLLFAGVGLVVAAICVSGCEPRAGFHVTNATNQILTVQESEQAPGQSAAPLNPADLKITLQPGQVWGLPFSLARGGCLNMTLTAYDQNGRLVDEDPTPICEDTSGHGNTWIIKGK
jgi:hypothetical protein